MKKSISLLLFLLFALPLISCSSQSGNQNFNPAGDEENNLEDAGNENQNNQVVINTGRKIIYTASYDITCDELSAPINDIGDKLIELEGYVAKINTYTNSAIYVYKIPTDKFNSFLDYVDSYDGVANKTITSNDITSSYSQIEAKIATLEASKAAYESLLSSGSLSMSDIIAINREISDIQQQLLNLYNQKDSFDNQLEFSQVTIQYYKNVKYIVKEDNIWTKYSKYLLKIGETILYIVLYTAPFALIIFAIIGIITLNKKRKKIKG